MLDLIVEGVPSPAKKGAPIEVDGAGTAAFVFKTIADPFAGRINLFRVLQGEITTDSTLTDARTHGKERMGTLLQLQGKEHTNAAAFGAGDLGAASKLKDVATGDLLLDSDKPVELPDLGFPEPVMSFAVTPKAKGDEEKMGAGLRRLREEDPTLSLRRDPQTGEQLLSGMSQMHVEVAVDRLHGRFGVDVELHPPRVPYLETIRKESRAQGRYKKQTGGRGQFGDCHVVLEPLDGPHRLRVRRQDRRRRDPAELPPGGGQGDPGGDAARRARGRAGAGCARPARGRLLPHRRLLGDGVQDRRLDGVQAGLREGRPGAARADHGDRGDGPGRHRRRRQRRPQLAPRTAARDGAARRDDHDQGRGADGRDPHVLPVAHVDDRRAAATTRCTSSATRRCRRTSPRS